MLVPRLPAVEPRPRTRLEVASFGFDPVLCGLGSDPYGSLAGPRLRVPTLPTSAQGTRYLFQLCTMPLPRWPVRLVGVRQWLELGLNTTVGGGLPYILTKLVGRAGAGNPFWRFSDANVSWHVRLVRQIPQIPYAGQNVLTCDSFVWRWSGTPALVFESATFAAANLNGRGHPDNYVALTGYVPPYGGAPLGEPVSNLGNFSDVRFPGDDPTRCAIDPIELEGPGYLVFYASLWQTNPGGGEIAGRPVLTVPGSFPVDPELPEDGFVADWPKAVYWGIGGALVVER